MHSLYAGQSPLFCVEYGILGALQLRQACSQDISDAEEAMPFAGKEPTNRGPGYISDADQFAKGGFGEVWRATRRPAKAGTFTLS